MDRELTREHTGRSRLRKSFNHEKNMEFEIDEEYLVSVTETKEITYTYVSGDIPEHFAKLLDKDGKFTGKSTSSHDHPEFTKFREMLGANGFIEIERRWINGDTVIKPFTLNGILFKAGRQFACGVALGYQLKVCKKLGYTSN